MPYHLQQHVSGTIRPFPLVTGVDSFTELVLNGGFDSGDNWTITAAKWTIADGVATADDVGNGLNQTFPVTVPSGALYELRFTVGGASQDLRTIFTLAGTPVETVTGGLLLSEQIIRQYAAASFDGIRFQTESGLGTLDDVSLRVRL